MAYERRGLEAKDHQLFILNGELRGVSVPLDGKPLSIGTSDDHDIVLLDEDDDHASVSLTPVEAGNCDVGDAIGRVKLGNRYLKPLKSRPLKPGVTLSVGSVDMMVARSLSAAEHASRTARRRSSGLAWAASFGIVVAAIGLVGLSGGQGGADARSVASLDAVNTSVKVETVSAEEAALDLQRTLEAQGFDRISAVAGGDGVVGVSGKLRKSEEGQWREVSMWFDGAHGGSLQLDTGGLLVMPDAVTLPFGVEAVWMGSAPSLTLHDGSKRRAGDALPGGWRLDKVTADSVTITKDEETLVVPL